MHLVPDPGDRDHRGHPVLKEPSLSGEMESVGWPGPGALGQEHNPPSDPVGLSPNLHPVACPWSRNSQVAALGLTPVSTRTQHPVPGALGPCTHFHSNYAWMPPKPAAGAPSPSPAVAASTHCGSGAAPSLRSRPAHCRAGAPPP